MKYLIISILILSSAICMGQTNDKLDARYGLKIFKLKSNPSAYKGKLKRVYRSGLPKGVETYNYTGGDVTKVSGVAIEEIDLTFFNSQLMSIYIQFVDDFFNKEEYETMLGQLQYIYGDGHRPNNVKIPYYTTVGHRLWRGKKYFFIEVNRIWLYNGCVKFNRNNFIKEDVRK